MSRAEPARPEAGEISVVIPAYNAASTLVALLESLRAQTLAPLEVIVVDNDSTDGTAEVALSWHAKHPSFPLRVEQEPKRGRNHSRNAGIRRAAGKWIAFFDADCVVREDWVANCSRQLGETQAAAIGGVTGGHSFETETEVVLHVLHNPKALPDKEFLVADEWAVMRGAIETNNVLVETATLRRVGGFAESGYEITGEDFDLFLRILRSGAVVIGHHRDLVVYHRHRSTPRAMMRQVFDYGRSFAEVVARNYPRRCALVGRRGGLTFPFPVTVWLAPSRAFFKACLVIVLLGWSPLVFGVPGLFLLALAFWAKWHRTFKRLERPAEFGKVAHAVFIAIAHKAALVAGHAWGSAANRIWCLP